MHVLITNFNQSPTIGLYGFANDKFCLIGRGFRKKIKKMEEVLKVPCYEISILKSDLIGAFVNGNNDFLIVPELEDNELKELSEICKKHDVKLIIFPTKLNALGNNIVIGKKTILVNPEYSKEEIKMLKELTNYNIEPVAINEINAIGSVIKTNSKGALVGFIAESMQDFLEHNLGLKVTLGSVLNGSPYVSAAVIVNSNGFIASENNTGIELGIIDEAFGFVNND